MTVVAGVSVGSSYAMHQGSRTEFPAQELAKQIGARWAAQFPSAPVRYVAADVWLGGMLTAYHPNRPSVLISGNFKHSPWVTRELIHDAGAVLVWHRDPDGERLMREFPDAIPQSPLELPFQTGAKVPAARINWAILPPARAFAAASHALAGPAPR